VGRARLPGPGSASLPDPAAVRRGKFPTTYGWRMHVAKGLRA